MEKYDIIPKIIELETDIAELRETITHLYGTEPEKVYDEYHETIKSCLASMKECLEAAEYYIDKAGYTL